MKQNCDENLDKMNNLSIFQSSTISNVKLKYQQVFFILT